MLLENKISDKWQKFNYKFDAFFHYFVLMLLKVTIIFFDKLSF